MTFDRCNWSYMTIKVIHMSCLKKKINDRIGEDANNEINPISWYPKSLSKMIGKQIRFYSNLDTWGVHLSRYCGTLNPTYELVRVPNDLVKTYLWGMNQVQKQSCKYFNKYFKTFNICLISVEDNQFTKKKYCLEKKP